MTTVGSFFKLLDTLDLDPALSAQKLDALVRQGAVLHVTNTWCKGRSSLLGPLVDTTASFDELRTGACPECVPRAFDRAARSLTYTRATPMELIWAALTVEATVLRTTHRLKSSQVVARGRITLLQKNVASVLEALKNPSSTPSPALKLVFETLTERLSAASNALSAQLRTDSSQTKVLDSVVRRLLPRGWSRADAGLDETDTLIALVVPLTTPKDTAELLGALALERTGNIAVLRAPRFVYDHLQRTVSPAIIQAVPLTGVTPEVLETTLTLWDPTHPGEMRSLSQALAVASALV